MNKELILKYRTEFDHWLNEGQLLYTYPGITGWQQCKTDHPWIQEQNTYIIKDRYVELRKAFAKGKTIQFHNNELDFSNVWHDETDTTLEFVPHCDYRIKPEEPKFKVGNWVRLTIFDNTIHQITSLSWDNYKNCFHPTLEGFYGNIDSEDSLEHWKPQPGEFVIPEVDIDSTSFVVVKWKEEDDYACQPFIGELPTHLKK